MPLQPLPSDIAQPATVDYRTPATSAEQRRAQTATNCRFLGRLILVGVGLVLTVVLLIAGYFWWDQRNDEAVGNWMNGPRTDPLVSILLTAGTHSGAVMEAKVQDTASLAYVSRLLPTASRECQEPSGGYVRIVLRFASGNSIDTEGCISVHALSLHPPAGDWYGGWEFVTIDLGPTAPKPVADAFSFAVHGSGKRQF